MMVFVVSDAMMITLIKMVLNDNDNVDDDDDDDDDDTVQLYLPMVCRDQH